MSNAFDGKILAQRYVRGVWLATLALTGFSGAGLFWTAERYDDDDDNAHWFTRSVYFVLKNWSLRFQWNQEVCDG